MEKVQGLGFSEYHRSRVLDLGLNLSFSALVNSDEFLHQKVSQAKPGEDCPGCRKQLFSSRKAYFGILHRFRIYGFRVYGLSHSFSAFVSNDEFLHQRVSFCGKLSRSRMPNTTFQQQKILIWHSPPLSGFVWKRLRVQAVGYSRIRFRI